MTAPIDLTALAALAEAATPAPYVASMCVVHEPRADWRKSPNMIADLGNGNETRNADAAFIVAACNAALPMIREIESLRAEVTTSKAEHVALDVTYCAAIGALGAAEAALEKANAEAGAMREALAPFVDSSTRSGIEILRTHDAAVRVLSTDAGRAIVDELAALRATAKLAARWLGAENATERFDDIAEWFRRETGIMRPGKSVPLEMGGAHSDEERRQAFSTWADAKAKEVRAALAKAGAK